MRNLVVVTERKVHVPAAIAQHKLVSAAYDCSSGRFFFASDACRISSLSSSPSLEAAWSVKLTEGTGSSDLPPSRLHDGVVGLEYVLEEDALLVGMEAGDLLLLRAPSEEVEEVGHVEGGIVSMCASPDGELMAVATGLGQILLMTQGWDVVHEVCVDQPGDAWGKAGTESLEEFIPPGGIKISWRGDGKYFATLDRRGTGRVKIWERETGSLHACAQDTGFVVTAIAWRPSGAGICVSCDRSSLSRPPAVVLFEKNGLRKEAFDVIGPCEAQVDELEWNCDSSLLAVLLRCDEWNAVQVWNCKNYHWYLKQEWRFSGRDSVHILWDPEKPLRLSCWTSAGVLQSMDMCWNSAVIYDSLAFVIDGTDLLVTPLSVALIPPPMALFKLRFDSPVQAISCNAVNCERTLVAAFLADGHLAVVSCPGVDRWVDLEDGIFPVQSVKTAPSLAPLNRLRHLTWMTENVLLGVWHSVDPMVSADRDMAGGSVGEDRCTDVLVELELSRDGSIGDSTSSVYCDGWSLASLRPVPVKQSIVAVSGESKRAQNVDDDKLSNNASAFIQFSDGSVHSYMGTERPPKGDAVIKGTGTCFGTAAPWMKVLSLGSRTVMVALSENGNLQVNEKSVDRECTSFALHYGTLGGKNERSVHLVYTTRSNLLHITSFSELLDAEVRGDEAPGFSQLLESSKLGPQKNSEKKPCDVRFIRKTSDAGPGSCLKPINVWERGAILVATVCGRDVSVVLQTIRGNLETLYPRKLLLAGIADALQQGDFGDAMSLARRHHLNLNVLVDYIGWENFVPVATAFVRQISNLSHITDFVCAISNDDVTSGLYRNLVPRMGLATGGAKGTGDHPNSATKIQGVLSAVRVALEKEIAASPARELCILTTLACNDPPELEEALKRVKELREAEIFAGGLFESENGIEGMVSQTSITSKLTAASAVKHLIWLTDADKVYSAALGLYDLHLAAMVASEAQKDPREFLPVLQDLEEMPAPLMRYTVDYRLGRFESALKNLAAAGDEHFQECLKLVQKNPQLFPEALQIFKEGDRRLEFMTAWGDHLLAEERFVDAAAAFCAAGKLDKLLLCYRAGGHWEGVLSVAGRLKLGHQDMKQLIYEVCEELQAMGRPGDAAKVALEYMKDVDLSVKLLVDARSWSEAIRLSHLYERSDLLTQVDAGASECANTQIKEFEEGLEKIRKYYVRYLAVRQRRLLLAAKLKEGQIDEDELNDAASDTSSSVSGLSGMSIYDRGTPSGSAGTSINPSTRGGTRKQQKQARQKSRKGGLRAGSQGEEDALLEHVKELAWSVRTKEELGRLLEALLFLGHEDLARRLQDVASKYEATQQEAVRLAEKKKSEEKAEAPEHISPSTKDGLSQVDEVRWKLTVLSPAEVVQPSNVLHVQ